MRHVGLYWFGDDLRLADQPGLQRAAREDSPFTGGEDAARRHRTSYFASAAP